MYFQLFPSLFLLRYRKTKSACLIAAGSDGPATNLNPFDYSSPYFYTQGNPLLQPETTHSIEFSYLFKRSEA
ncbi:hypothetical protein CS542_07485 [Pedobacter sp. IW39]|nr:hypothetical protein CS542_07485 [Pedobacter sp. IW39]